MSRIVSTTIPIAPYVSFLCAISKSDAELQSCCPFFQPNHKGFCKFLGFALVGYQVCNNEEAIKAFSEQRLKAKSAEKS